MSARLLVIGDGKMGRAVAQLAAERGLTVVGVYGPADMAQPIAPGIADVAIEFTQPDAAAANVRAALTAGLPIACGTTGWDAELATVRGEVPSTTGALLHAHNFSLGVFLFRPVPRVCSPRPPRPRRVMRCPCPACAWDPFPARTR